MTLTHNCSDFVADTIFTMLI